MPWLTRRRRHGKPSSVAWCDWLRQDCVKSSVACAWLASGLRGVGVMRRVVHVRWRDALAQSAHLCVMRSQSACAYAPMRLKLPAHNACVVFRRLGSWFLRENPAFRCLTYGKLAAHGGVRGRFAFLSIGVPFVGCGTNTHGGRTPPTERVTPRCEDLLFDK